MKLDRLVSIIVVLLRKERVQAKELAEMFEVSVRTILRDVDAINLAGIPIVTYQGANGGIGIAEGYRLDKSVLTSDEMASLLSALKGISGTLPDSKHEILLEKFRNIISPSQAELLNTKSKQFIIDLSPWIGNDQLKENLKILEKAISECKIVRFSYLDSFGSRTSRTAEPYSLVLKGQNWYLYAWCILREDFRLFKISRIKELELLKETYIPKEISLERLELENEPKRTGKEIKLKLLFDKELFNIVEAFYGDDAELLEDGKSVVMISAEEDYQLYGYLLSFGPGLEVLEPPHIRKILAEAALKMFQKYSDIT